LPDEALAKAGAKDLSETQVRDRVYAWDRGLRFDGFFDFVRRNGGLRSE